MTATPAAAAQSLPPLPPLANPAEVLAAIDALPAGAWLATDADETLWAADVGDELVRLAAAGGGPFAAGSADFAWYSKEMSEGDYAGACRFAAQLLSTVDAEAVRVALEPVLAQVRCRGWLVRALARASARGVHVAIVSASPRLVVQWACAVHGLETAQVIGIEVSGSGVREPAPVGFGKVAAWLELGLAQPQIALGDSRWDAPLLAMARHGFLLAKASADHWDVL